MGIEKMGTKKNAFAVVGIGASAGGMEALEQFFANMPSDSGMAFVIVQHLDPAKESILCELAKGYTRMKVFEVKEKIKIEQNCVYTISPNRDMTILHGTLSPIKPVDPRGLRRPIDFFFRSLAQDQKHKAIGIILSGTCTDGTVGIKAIKGEGGLVIVQDPGSARFDGMPKSAISTGIADHVLPSVKIPDLLMTHFQRVFDQD
jgi:two-component system CheB/CheR fusion protein